MNSKTISDFWKRYYALPASIQAQAKKSFKMFRDNPFHPSLYFKRVHANRPIFSVRITKDYRAIGVQQQQEIIWFWIGLHSEYEKLLKKL